ncbi:MAG: hypothetical protein IT462_09760 [Planctomycetes bacterium]|nr:hypothetical protein [Planctomycetota bacterium]
MRLLNQWSLPLVMTAAALCAPAFADIGPKPRTTAPGLELTGKDYEGINVEMTSEDVKLVLSKPEKRGEVKLDVEVTFNMTNLGDAASFEVGFPVGPYKTLEEFSVTTGGVSQDFELIDRAPKAEKAESKGGRSRNFDERHDYWYVWNASYKANGPTVHVVKYSLNVWHHSDWRHTGYILHTGAAWKNAIKKATVSLTFGAGITLDNVYEIGPAQGCKIGQDRVDWVFENLNPTEKDNIKLELNVRHGWSKQVELLREESKTYWSSKCELCHRLAEAPKRQAREKFTAAELNDYLDALAAVISELKEEEGKYVMPHDDPVHVTYGEDDEDNPMTKAVGETMKNQRDLRPYAGRGSASNLLVWFERTLKVVKDYADNPKARETLAKYEALVGHFLDGKLFAGATKLEYAGRSAEKSLATLRANRDEARKLLGLDTIEAK